MTVRPVPDDAEQPGGETVGVAAVFEPFERCDESVLADVVRVRGFADHRERDEVGRPQMPAHQPIESLRIAAPGALDESGIIGLRHTLPTL
jgi:hypothetical protein